MPPKTVKMAIYMVLQELSQKDFEKFCFTIANRRGEPRVRLHQTNKKREEVTKILVNTFTESVASVVAVEALETIHCNEHKETLKKYLSELPGSAKNVSKAASFRHADIMALDTTGASMKTAEQDNLKYSGVKASHAMAETDLFEMNNYKSTIQNAAQSKGVDPALVAAIISRSCRAGRTLSEDQRCYDEETKKAYCFGLMQLYVNPDGGGHTPEGTWDSEEHLCQGIDILLRSILSVKHEFPDWNKKQQLKGGIATYFTGNANFKSYAEVDAMTSGGDYSSDVIARAQWYKDEGGF